MYETTRVAYTQSELRNIYERGFADACRGIALATGIDLPAMPMNQQRTRITERMVRR